MTRETTAVRSDLRAKQEYIPFFSPLLAFSSPCSSFSLQIQPFPLTTPPPGRLHEKCVELLAGADIKFNRQHRLDVALVQNHPIALYVFDRAARYIG
jgi:hypothetical protein